MLSRSRRAALISRSGFFKGELIVNGGFDTDTIWFKPTGGTISGGVAVKVSGTAGTFTQSIVYAAGGTYRVSYTIVTYTAGAMAARLIGGTFVLGANRLAVGTYTEDLVAAAGNNVFGLYVNSVFDGTIDNVSLRRIA